ncbi:hypothetical protein ACNQGB_17570 [Flavobacterium sp. XS1P32]|uniref:hypothetical protein n=1 Tax=unclassified Flavobacterium TaxID=196869 RepID=UPI003AAC229F
MTESEFEKSFQQSNRIIFFKTENYNVEPPVISIVFDNALNGINAYNYLVENLTKDELSLVFRIKNNEKLNLSLIDKKSSKIYNIDNLKFNKKEYDDFQENGKFGKYCIFCISEVINNQIIFKLNEGTSPLMVSELNFA